MSITAFTRLFDTLEHVPDGDYAGISHYEAVGVVLGLFPALPDALERLESDLARQLAPAPPPPGREELSDDELGRIAFDTRDQFYVERGWRDGYSPDTFDEIDPVRQEAWIAVARAVVRAAAVRPPGTVCVAREVVDFTAAIVHAYIDHARIPDIEPIRLTETLDALTAALASEDQS